MAINRCDVVRHRMYGSLGTALADEEGGFVHVIVAGSLQKWASADCIFVAAAPGAAAPAPTEAPKRRPAKKKPVAKKRPGKKASPAKKAKKKKPSAKKPPKKPRKSRK